MFVVRSEVLAAWLILFFVAFLIYKNNSAASTLPTIFISPEWHDVDLQLVPSTVNMFSALQLDSAGVQNTHQLQTITPGLVFTSNVGMGQAYLRGVGSTVSAASAARVATFVDGVYLTRAVQAMQDFFDVKRVEVIKGPQGVHLGRNVVGGAISIITQDPQPYREAYVDALYGSSNQRQLRGMVNQPLDNNWSLRIAGLMDKRDGYSRNIYRDEDIDDRDYYAWRGKLRYQPTNKLDVIFSAEQNRQDDTSNMAKQPNPDVGVNGGILLGGTVPDDPREVTHNTDQYQDSRGNVYSTKITWKTGDIELRSITAYQSIKQDDASDLDGTNVDFASNYPASVVDNYSQEFRLGSYQGETFNWIAGVFLSKEDATQQDDVHLPLMGYENLSMSSTVNDSYALFGEINYLFSAKWQGRAGLRYTYSLGVLGPAGVSTTQLQAQQDWQAVTPELGLTFHADADTFYYGKISRGYTSGGYNAYAVQPSYDPEYMWAYEAGVKSDIPSRLLRINAALFYYDYSDMQLLTLPPTAPPGTLPIITNAAEAVIQGIDLQVWYQPVTDLELTAGTTLLDARYKEFNSVDPNNPADDPDRAGDRLPMAPDVSLVLGATYHWSQLREGDLRLSVNYKYQSAVYFNAYQDDAVRQDAYGLVNASLSYSGYSSHWYTELYGNNLTDELYAQNIIRIDPVLGTARYWGEPRTFGFRLGYKI